MVVGCALTDVLGDGLRQQLPCAPGTSQLLLVTGPLLLMAGCALQPPTLLFVGSVEACSLRWKLRGSHISLKSVVLCWGMWTPGP